MTCDVFQRILSTHTVEVVRNGALRRGLRLRGRPANPRRVGQSQHPQISPKHTPSSGRETSSSQGQLHDNYAEICAQALASTTDSR